MKYKAQSNLKPNKGFTLVELLVAMGIFVIVVTIVSSIFIRNLRTQQSIVALIAANDSASLALEQMAREMRTGWSFCNNLPPGESCSENKTIFINAYGESIIYKLEDNAIKRGVDNSSFSPITADNVKVESLAFIARDNVIGDKKPTKITIILSVRPKGGNIEAAVTNLQTTVTSRRFDE